MLLNTCSHNYKVPRAYRSAISTDHKAEASTQALVTVFLALCTHAVRQAAASNWHVAEEAAARLLMERYALDLRARCDGTMRHGMALASESLVEHRLLCARPPDRCPLLPGHFLSRSATMASSSWPAGPADPPAKTQRCFVLLPPTSGTPAAARAILTSTPVLDFPDGQQSQEPILSPSGNWDPDDEEPQQKGPSIHINSWKSPET